MSEEMNNQVKSNGEEESFAELFEQYSEQGGTDSIEVGDKIQGKIISIGENGVFVDTGSKLDGYVEKDELLDEDGSITVVDGDTIELYVVAKDSSGIKLSRAISGIGGLRMLEEAKAKGLPVEGKIESTCKGGFNVTVLHRRAFCPVSQVDNRFVENAEEYVGQTHEFIITKLEQGGRNIVISRRALLEREREASEAQFRESVNVGDTVEGTVARLMNFGAFVEIAPGIEGLVHVSELGYGRVGHPEEAVSIGQKVQAKIKKIDTDDKGRMKISLSMKELAQDPWDSVAATFAEGQKVTGKVIRLADFGAFVEIAPGLDGLVHVSEMSYTKRVHKPSDMVSEGDTVSVKIKSIDLDKRRIGLSMKDAEGDPWLDVADKYAAGQTVTGTVEKQEQFGIFVNLEPGITGLLPKSVIAKSEKPAEYDKLRSGEEVTLKIGQVRAADRKISLQPVDMEEVEDWKDYAPKPRKQKSSGSGHSANSGGGFGSLGAALQDAMNKKK